MSYDTEAIRGKVTMMQLLEADNIPVVRKAGRWFASCPFHEEKTASFAVTERTGLFICFGCGAGTKSSGIKGDIFGYWMATRGVDFSTAAAALARMAGTGEMPEGARLPPRKVASKELHIPPPLEGRDLDKWEEGVAFLKKSEEWQVKLSQWRGYAMDTIGVMIERRKIALPIYFQARRWAFPVHAIQQDGTPFLCGWHVRLDPAKEGGKAPWHYVPNEREDRPSIGAWPLVIGDPRKARTLQFFEGEWDALAGADACGWSIEPEAKGTAIFGVRGGRNLRHTLAWMWPDTAQAFLFPDGDETGLSWADLDGLASMVRQRSRAVHTFTFNGVKDFNDYHKRRSRDGRAVWLTFLRSHHEAGEKTRKKRKPKPRQPKTD